VPTSAAKDLNRLGGQLGLPPCPNFSKAGSISNIAKLLNQSVAASQFLARTDASI
jgi:hypothetical protein